MKSTLAKITLAVAVGAALVAFTPVRSEAALCASTCGKVTKWCTQKYVTKKGYKLYTPLLCKQGNCPKAC